MATNKFLTGQFLTRWFGQIKFDWTCNKAIAKTSVLFIFAGGIRCSSPMTAFVNAQDKVGKALESLMLLNDINDKNDSVL